MNTSQNNSKGHTPTPPRAHPSRGLLCGQSRRTITLLAVMVVAALSVVESYLRLNSGLGISMELADTDLDHWANSGQAAERTVRVMQSGRVVISGGGSGKGGRKSLETLEAESQKPHRNLIHGDDAHPHSGELAKAAAKAAHRTGPIQVLNLTDHVAHFGDGASIVADLAQAPNVSILAAPDAAAKAAAVAADAAAAAVARQESTEILGVAAGLEEGDEDGADEAEPEEKPATAAAAAAGGAAAAGVGVAGGGKGAAGRGAGDGGAGFKPRAAGVGASSGAAARVAAAASAVARAGEDLVESEDEGLGNTAVFARGTKEKGKRNAPNACQFFRGGKKLSSIVLVGNAEILYELRSSISKYSLVMRFDAPADFLCGDQLDLWGLTYNPKAPTKFSGLHELADGCSTYETVQAARGLFLVGGSEASAQAAMWNVTNAAPFEHFPMDQWQPLYLAKGAKPATQPSALWIGLQTALECTSGMEGVEIHLLGIDWAAVGAHDSIFEEQQALQLAEAGRITIHSSTPEL